MPKKKGLLVPYKGIVEITGGHDVGKTIAALQTVYPYDNVAFVDDDVKGDGTVRQMKEAGEEFRDYINLGAMRSELGSTPTADQLLDHVVIPTIDKLTSGKKYDVIIWDTWRIVYSSFRDHVARNQSKYSSVVKFQGSSTIIQGLISKVARTLERTAMEQLRSSCELLILTHHIKPYYVDNVVVGDRPESSRTFDEICNMRMWLRRNPDSKVPVILFLKRPSRPVMKKGQMVFENIVPLKVTPTAKHESIWEAIKEYEDNPVESRQPEPHETPSPEELFAIKGTLSDEQRDYVKSVIQAQKVENEALLATLKPEADEPETASDLITMSSEQYDLNVKELAGVIGTTVKKLMKFNVDEVHDAWIKVVENG